MSSPHQLKCSSCDYEMPPPGKILPCDQPDYVLCYICDLQHWSRQTYAEKAAEVNEAYHARCKGLADTKACAEKECGPYV